MRLRLDLAYDGGAFHGWAAQPALRTVQGELERALALVLRFPEVSVTCAGRTDAGVHARGQVTHLDVDESSVRAAAGRSEDPPESALQRRLNRVLAEDVRVRRVRVAPQGFDARFSALWRRYVYRLVDQPEHLDPLQRGSVVAWSRPLDVPSMNRASRGLLGERDFAAYCRPRAGATTIRHLQELTWVRTSPGLVVGTVRADAFCHSMVRALVGALVAVGEGRRPPAWPAGVLAEGKRDPGVQVMPAHGLTLEEVRYPTDGQGLARRAGETRTVRSLG